MRKRIVLILGILLNSTLAVHATNFRPMVGSGFSAPTVDGEANVGNPQVGDIIFDTNANEFAGYGGPTPGWMALSGWAITLAPPAIHLFTSSSSYTPPTSPAPLYIGVTLTGGGGGGGGSTGAGGFGGTATFGTQLSCTGESGGSSATVVVEAEGAGATCSLGTITNAFKLAGGSGGGTSANTTNVGILGGSGGTNPLGGGGGGGAQAAGMAGAGSTGGGGRGAGQSGAFNSAAGGGAGGYAQAIIANPTGSYSYTVGTAGSAGSGVNSGGAGGAGMIMVEEFYQ
jgi:hypothetical protein